MEEIVYQCKDCKTIRYLTFPNGDESLILCSACYRLRVIKANEGEEKTFISKRYVF